MEKIIFIDRDGVINVDLMGYVMKPDEFQFEEGAIDALKMLCIAGYKIIIISNQAGVGDGLFTEEELWEVHDHMLERLKKHGIEVYKTEYCLHSKYSNDSSHRKPAVGMFQDAVGDLQFDKGNTFFIGDKATDIEAGKNFGIRTAFVRTGHGEKDEALLRDHLEPDLRGDNLLEIANLILSF